MQKFTAIFQSITVRNYASPNRIKDFRRPKVYKQMESEAISMKAKGFLRPIKPYDPPKDFNQRITDIAKELNVTNLNEKRFEFLNKCAISFNHAVPNSRLYEMKTINNVIDFYATPVDCHTPYESLVKRNEIPNLHVIPEAKRYDPETDGISAFPKSSNIVVGLKNRKKYKSHIAKTSWP